MIKLLVSGFTEGIRTNRRIGSEENLGEKKELNWDDERTLAQWCRLSYDEAFMLINADVMECIKYGMPIANAAKTYVLFKDEYDSATITIRGIPHSLASRVVMTARTWRFVMREKVFKAPSMAIDWATSIYNASLKFEEDQKFVYEMSELRPR